MVFTRVLTEEQMREKYGFDLSTSTISQIRDKITDEIVVLQNRPLDPVYLIAWMGVLTDIKECGVNDIFIIVTDNLNGVTNTIKNVFSGSITQICVVLLIRTLHITFFGRTRKSLQKILRVFLKRTHQKSS